MTQRHGEIHRASDSYLQGFIREGTTSSHQGVSKGCTQPSSYPVLLHSPSFFQRADCCPLLSPWVVTLNRLKELPIGASTHCIDFLLHSCIAANLVEKSTSEVTHKCTLTTYIHVCIWVACIACQTMLYIKILSRSFGLVYKERSCSSSFLSQIICYSFYLKQKIEKNVFFIYICINSLPVNNVVRYDGALTFLTMVRSGCLVQVRL